jgi:hypothetical protein
VKGPVDRAALKPRSEALGVCRAPAARLAALRAPAELSALVASQARALVVLEPQAPALEVPVRQALLLAVQQARVVRQPLAVQQAPLGVQVPEERVVLLTAATATRSSTWI